VRRVFLTNSSFDFVSVGGEECLPGPLGERCRNNRHGYYNEEGDEYENTDYDQDVDAASYSNYQGDNTGADYQDRTTAGGGGFSEAGGAFRVWMVFLVGSILSATVAVHLGQRKNPMVQGRTANSNNEMKGAVARRIGSVSAFAAGAFAGSKGSNEVEMNESSQPLQMDMGPDVTDAPIEEVYDNVV
jgi:predicted dehydrogenase